MHCSFSKIIFLRCMLLIANITSRNRERLRTPQGFGNGCFHFSKWRQLRISHCEAKTCLWTQKLAVSDFPHFEGNTTPELLEARKPTYGSSKACVKMFVKKMITRVCFLSICESCLLILLKARWLPLYKPLINKRH